MPSLIMGEKYYSKSSYPNDEHDIKQQQFEQYKRVAEAMAQDLREYADAAQEAGLKRRAKQLKKELKIKHCAALDVAATESGFESYRDATKKKHHDKVKKGYCLRFIDGDKTNITIENLEMISLSENARLNQMDYKNSPEELKPTIRLQAKLMAKKGELS